MKATSFSTVPHPAHRLPQEDRQIYFGHNDLWHTGDQNQPNDSNRWFQGMHLPWFDRILLALGILLPITNMVLPHDHQTKHTHTTDRVESHIHDHPHPHDHGSEIILLDDGRVVVTDTFDISTAEGFQAFHDHGHSHDTAPNKTDSEESLANHIRAFLENNGLSWTGLGALLLFALHQLTHISLAGGAFVIGKQRGIRKLRSSHEKDFETLKAYNTSLNGENYRVRILSDDEFIVEKLPNKAQ